jgi:hypothetical protein
MVIHKPNSLLKERKGKERKERESKAKEAKNTEKLLHISLDVCGLEVIAGKTEWTVQISTIKNSS